MKRFSYSAVLFFLSSGKSYVYCTIQLEVIVEFGQRPITILISVLPLFLLTWMNIQALPPYFKRNLYIYLHTGLLHEIGNLNKISWRKNIQWQNALKAQVGTSRQNLRNWVIGLSKGKKPTFCLMCSFSNVRNKLIKPDFWKKFTIIIF